MRKWSRINGIELPDVDPEVIESLLSDQTKKIQNLTAEVELLRIENRRPSSLEQRIRNIETDDDDSFSFWNILFVIGILGSLVSCVVDTDKDEDPGTTTHINKTEDKSDFGYNFD